MVKKRLHNIFCSRYLKQFVKTVFFFCLYNLVLKIGTGGISGRLTTGRQAAVYGRPPVALVQALLPGVQGGQGAGEERPSARKLLRGGDEEDHGHQHQ